MRASTALALLALLTPGIVLANAVEIYDPGEALVSNPAPLLPPMVVTDVLWDNGPLVTCPGCGVGGADESTLQTTSLGMTTLGFGHQADPGINNWVADDFTVTHAGGWDIESFSFFAYQTNSSTTSTMTALHIRIWDGPPGGGGMVIWGDDTTDMLTGSTWTNIYRVTETTAGTATNRPIMVNLADLTAELHLAPGTYWLDWQTDGTLSSGPWAPPITILGSATTGDALQSINGGTHAPIQDTGSFTPQGLPFIIEGTVTGGGPLSPYCSTPSAPIPDNGTLNDTISVPDVGTLGDLDVYIDAPHTWTGDLDFTLTHVDTATSATIIDRPGVPATGFGCSSDDYDVTVNDEGPDGDIESQCDSTPPAINGNRQGGDPPGTVLMVFDGDDYSGDWTLTINDNAGGDTGTLVEWCLLPTGSGGGSPVIDVTPTDLSSTQPPDVLVVDTLTISNTGGADLDWIIEEASPVYRGGPAKNPQPLMPGPSTLGSDGPYQTGLEAYPPRFLSPDALVNDGSFENGPPPGSAWTETADNSCEWIGDWDVAWGVAGYDGLMDFWAAGYCVGVPSTDSVEQTMTIPASTTDLSFWYVTLRVDPDDADADYAYIEVDGTTIWLLDLITANNTSPTWVNVQVDVSAWAGLTVPVEFGAVSAGSETGNIRFDYIEWIGGDPCATPSDIPWASVAPSTGTTPPAGFTDVDVTFDSTGIPGGTYNGVLCVESNDPATPLVPVPLELIVDAINVDLAITKDDGSTTAIPGTPVTYTIEATNLTVTQLPTYTVSDSDDPGGPVYDFVDITATGTPIVLGDDAVSGAIPMGFTFNYFAIDYTDIYISSNGFLRVLASGNSGCCTGDPIPTAGGSEGDGIIAGWWEDLRPPSGGSIHYETQGVPGSQVHIVQFTDIQHFFSGNPVTFQYKLFEGTNVIEVHYLNAASDGGTHSAGIENETGTVGYQYYRGTASLPPMLAVRYQPEIATVAGATVADAFPAELVNCTWTCVATPGSACAAAGAGDIADTVDLEGGGTVTYTATCDIDPFATGTLSNTAEVIVPMGYFDIVPANNTATDDDTLEPTADLMVTKTDSPDPVYAGDDLTYTVTITNLGPSGVLVAQGFDTLPPEVAFIETSGCAEDPLGVSACTVGMIAPGGAKIYTILASVQAGVDGVIINDVTVSGSAFDPVPANNTDTEPTTVIGDADLELVKFDDFDPRMAGKTQTYRLAVTNNGPAAAAGVVLEEILPTDTFFVSIEPAAPTCIEAAGIINCDLPNLANGETFEVRFDLWIDKEFVGTMVNSGSVTHQQTDPVPANDADDELTDVVTFKDMVGLASVNGNASSDVAVLEAGSLKFSVVDTNTGAVISGETFQPNYKPVAMTMIPNFQETSAPELIILARNTATNGGAIFIRDAQTGAPIRLWGLSPDYRPVYVTAIPSIGGSSSWEIAALTLRYSDDRPRVFILDAKDGTLLKQFNFPIAFFPLSFGWVPDFSGGGAPELVVTGRRDDRAVATIFKDAATGATVSQWFTSHTVLPMATGRVPAWDGTDDRWAIFGRRGNDGANRIFVRNVTTGASDALFGSPLAWLPMDMEIADDFDGPGADETILLRWKPTNGDTRVTAKDASDGSFLAGSLTDPTFLPLDLEILPDWTGTLAQEGAVLGIHLGTGQVRVFLKDLGNGLDLGFVDVP